MHVFLLDEYRNVRMSMEERKVGISVSGKYKPPHKIPLIMEVCGGTFSLGMRRRR